MTKDKNNNSKHPEAQEIEESVEDLRVKIGKIEEDRDKHLDARKRTEADLANYRKDELRRLEEARIYARSAIIGEILEAMDNIEMAFRRAPPDVGQSPWYDGLKRSIKSFEDFFRRQGLEKIKTEGEKFDPVVHEAVEMADGGEPGQIIEEFRAGYKLNGRVLRPARVKISK